MSGRLTGVSKPNLSAITIDPTKESEVLSHLKQTTNFNLVVGTQARRTQAITTPQEYIDDKTLLWNAIISGSDGKGGGATTLKKKLPGAADANIPEMSSLVKEWQQTYQSLVSAGMPNDTAALQADAYTNLLFDQRISMFNTAFPGLIDDAYEASLKTNLEGIRAKATAAGIVDVPKQDKFEKYKKRAKKYKANKKSAATKST